MSHFIIRKKSNNQHIEFVRFWETFRLDEVARAKVFLVNQSKTQKDTYAQGNEIEILRNGQIDFIGKIIFRKETSGGGLFLELKGREIEIVEERCPTGSNKTKTYTSDDVTILNDLITATTWTLDTTNTTSISIDSFRTTNQMSVFQAIKRLIDLTGKDLNFDRDNRILYIYDRYPNNSRQINFNFIENKDISDFVQKDTQTANKVILYGKGDGDSQITGSAGSGTPVHVVTDKNVVSNGEANNYAQKILNRLQTARFRYEFKNQDTSGNYKLGMGGNLQAPATFEGSKSVDIVKIKREIDQDRNETLSFEVTNPELRRAKKTRAELQAEQNNLKQLTTMQGTTNIFNWGGQINAKSSAPLNLTFNIPESTTKDEVGILRNLDFSLDYDIDPFRSSIGTASQDDVANDVLNSSGNTEPGVTGSSGSNDAGVGGTSSSKGASESGYYIGDYSDTFLNADGSWTDAGGYVYIGNYDYLFHGAFFSFDIVGDITNTILDFDLYVRVKNTDTGQYHPDSGGVLILRKMELSSNAYQQVVPSGYIHVPYNWSNDTYRLQWYANNVGSSLKSMTLNYAYHGSRGHSHGDGSYRADSHGHSDGSFTVTNHAHPDGTYTGASHNHNISVGDDVSDASSLNATSVDIYLDYWDGTSWVNKHSILATGKTLDTDVDLSNSGTYPNATGYWRVRIYTDSTSPDLVKAITKLKHQMDN